MTRTALSVLLAIFIVSPLFGLTSKVREQIRDAAERVYLDPLLVTAIAIEESHLRPSVISPKGAMGIMQVMPKTANECNIQNAYHTLDNLMGACLCLRRMKNHFPDVKLALAAYNAGMGNVKKYGGIPPFPETRLYVAKVLATYESLKKSSF